MDTTTNIDESCVEDKAALDSVDPSFRKQGKIFNALSSHFAQYDDLLRTDILNIPQREDL